MESKESEGLSNDKEGRKEEEEEMDETMQSEGELKEDELG